VKNLRRASVLGASLLFSGCAVYVPTVPSTPLVRKAGEVELAGALRLSSLEAGIAWSPLPHVMLVGETALQNPSGKVSSRSSAGPATTTEYPSHHFQGGVGLGTYWLLGEHQQTYLGVLGGVGAANVDLYDHTGEALTLLLPIFGPAVPVRYQANYWRYYGQCYVAQQVSSKVRCGFSLRATLVKYKEILRDGQLVIYSPTQVFYEPHAFVRYGQGVLQGVATFGYSLPGTPATEDKRLITPTTLLASIGVVFRPAYLRHKN
jgi:hypothetical protein